MGGLVFRPIARIASTFIVILSIHALVAPASAQTAELSVDAAPVPSLDDTARAAFEAGRAALGAGRYDDALANFRRAHELSSRPELLFDIAIAADRLRRDDEALDAFERYLDAMPDAQNRSEVEARIRALRDAVASDMVSIAAAADTARAEGEAAASPLQEPAIYEAWWFWTIVGIAVVAAVAIPVGVVAGSSSQVDAPVPGSIGPGGIVIALDGP